MAPEMVPLGERFGQSGSLHARLLRVTFSLCLFSPTSVSGDGSVKVDTESQSARSQ